MSLLNLSSQVTFLYFTDIENAKRFFTETLELEKAYDPGWACVWHTGKEAFLGAVDAKEGSIEVTTRGGVLVSLTVNNIQEVHKKLSELGISDLSPIRKVKEIALESFFFTGPEGYKFEIQQFTSGELSRLF